MKKNTHRAWYICIFCFFTLSFMQISQTQAAAFDPTLQVEVQYSKQAKVSEAVPITSLITPKSFSMEQPMGMKVVCRSCPEADYSIRRGFPTSRITFNKPGTYTLTVSTGIFMSAG